MTSRKIDPHFYPILATNNKESSDSLLNKWDKFDALSETNQNKISSQETAKRIQQISFLFNLSQEQVSIISIAVRSYYFSEIQTENFPAILSKEMGVNLDIAQKISDLIIQKIINDDSQEKAYESQLEKLPIDIAVKKYPEVGEQLITSNYIKLKSFFEPVRPSIKNWLSDYTFNIGISNHDPIVRGNYLFKNENARKLSQQDRDKLSQILKSFEEKTPLAVNTNTKQVVFSAMASQERLATFQTDEERLSAWRKNLPLLENKNNNQSGANNIRFSSPQKFSTEKPPVKNNFFAARPTMKNVVDLREE